MKDEILDLDDREIIIGERVVTFRDKLPSSDWMGGHDNFYIDFTHDEIKQFITFFLSLDERKC